MVFGTAQGNRPLDALSAKAATTRSHCTGDGKELLAVGKL